MPDEGERQGGPWGGNRACLTNTAISIIRSLPQFQYAPEANRHFAARPQEALELLLQAP